MPLFDFKCQTCSQRFEARVPLGTEEHPCACGSSAARQFSPPKTLHVPSEWQNGTGWSLLPEQNRRFFQSTGTAEHNKAGSIRVKKPGA